MVKLYVYEAPSLGPKAVVRADGLAAAMEVLLLHPRAAPLRDTPSGPTDIRSPGHWREIPDDEPLVYLVEFWD